MQYNYSKKWADCAGKFTDQWEKIFAWFGKPEMTSIGFDYTQRPVTNHNVLQLLGTQNAPTTILLQTNFVALNGWHTKVAPLVKLDGLAAEYQKRTFHQSAMRPAPPESMPEFLTDSSEAMIVHLVKYHGAIEINAESLLTESGQDYMVMKNAQAVSSMHITIKLLIGRAIIGTKNEWMSLVKSNQYRSVREALEPELNMMFIANKHPKAIYIADKYVKDYTSAFQPRFDSIIVSHGTLNALVYGNNYDTKYAEIGSNSYDRLTRGGDSLSTALPGMTFYEDEVWSIQNLEPNMLNMLRRTIHLGEFSVIDGSDYGASCDTEDYHSNRDSSIAQLDVDRDNISTISLLDCVENDIAWQNGRASPLFDDFLKEIRGVLARTGIKIVGDQYDPWIIKTSSGLNQDGSRANNEGLHLITVWGNQALCYRSVTQDKKHGEWSKVRALKRLGAEKMNRVERLQSLSNRLFDVTDIKDESVRAYFFAIGSNPENWLTDYKSDSIYLKGDKHASPLPPYVDKEPGLNNKYYDARDRSYISNQAEDLRDRGAMYVMKDGRRYYVWILEYEDSPSVQLTAERISWLTTPNTDAKKTAIKERNAINIQKGALLDPLIFDDFARLTGNDYTNFLESDKGLDGKIKGFILAPFDIFGRVSADGKAYGWMENLKTISDRTIVGYDGNVMTTLNGNVELLSNEALFFVAAAALGYRTVDEINTGIAQVQAKRDILTGKMYFKRGIKPPRLAKAPIAPLGFSGIHSLRTLSDMYKNDTRGWDVSICKEAHECVEAYDAYANFLIGDYPDCILLNSIYSAEFMFTGNPDEDLKNIIHFNLMKSATYPLWVRVPGPLSISVGGVAAQLPALMFFSDKQNDPSGATNIASQMSNNDIANIAKFMGVNNVAGLAGGDVVTYGTLEPVISTVTWAQFKATLASILGNISIDPRIKDYLKDNKSTSGKAERLFKEYSSSRSNLGRSFSTMRRDEEHVPPKSVNDTFASFFVDEIYKLAATDINQAVSEFNMILSLAIASMTSSTGLRNDLTRDLIEGLKRHSVSRANASSKFEDYNTVADSRKRRITAPVRQKFTIPINEPSSIGWINSRLLITPTVWHAIYTMFSRETIDIGTAADYYQIPIRPSDPENPSEPLGGELIKITTDPTIDIYVGQFKQFKAARGEMRVENSAFGNTVLGNQNFFSKKASGRPGARSIRASNSMDTGSAMKRMRMERDPFAGIADQPHVIGTRISQDPTGPFYNMEEYVDRDGRPIPTKTRFVREENLETRMLEVYQTMDDIFERVPTMMFLLTEHTQMSLKIWLKAGLPIPDCVYLLARIGSLRADAAIWIESGRQTAQTGYNFAQNMISYNSLKDKLVLRYVAWFNSWVVDDKKVYIYDAFRATEYNGGLGNTFYNNEVLFNPENLNKQPKSINAFRCGSLWTLENAIQQNPISLFGKYDSDMFLQRINDPQGIIFNDVAQWPSFLFYDFVLNLRSLKSMVNKANLSSYSALKENECYDGLVWLRKFMKWNKSSKKHEIVVGGTSALKNADTPIRDVLCGGVGLFNVIYQ